MIYVRTISPDCSKHFCLLYRMNFSSSDEEQIDDDDDDDDGGGGEEVQLQQVDELTSSTSRSPAARLQPAIGTRSHTHLHSCYEYDSVVDPVESALFLSRIWCYRWSL